EARLADRRRARARAARVVRAGSARARQQARDHGALHRAVVARRHERAGAPTGAPRAPSDWLRAALVGRPTPTRAVAARVDRGLRGSRGRTDPAVRFVARVRAARGALVQSLLDIRRAASAD